MGGIITSAANPPRCWSKLTNSWPLPSVDERDAITVGYRLVGTSRLISGYIADASDALHEAFVRYDPDEYGAASPVGRSLRARGTPASPNEILPARLVPTFLRA